MLSWSGLGRGLGRTHRPLRPSINRWLRQHVIIERDWLMVAAFGVASAPLVANRLPIGASFLVECGARFLVFPELAAIFRGRLWRRRLRHRVPHSIRQRGSIHGHG